MLTGAPREQKNSFQNQSFIEACQQLYIKLSLKPHPTDPLIQYIINYLEIQQITQISTMLAGENIKPSEMIAAKKFFDNSYSEITDDFEEEDEEKEEKEEKTKSGPSKETLLEQCKHSLLELKKTQISYDTFFKDQCELKSVDFQEITDCLALLNSITDKEREKLLEGLQQKLLQIQFDSQTWEEFFSEIKPAPESKASKIKDTQQDTKDQKKENRTLKDFKHVKVLDSKSHGKSAAGGRLFVMKKKPRQDDDPQKSKYQSEHFVKYTRDEDNSNAPLMEVRLAEFLRAVIPRQPKARMLLSDSGQAYVQSKGVPNCARITNSDEERLLNPHYYGTNQYKLQWIYFPKQLEDQQELVPETCYVYLQDDQVKYAILVNGAIQKLPVPFSKDSNLKEKIKKILKNPNLKKSHLEKDLLYLCGCRGGIKGLGELNIFVGSIVSDSDYNYRNVLLDNELNIYSIDRGRTLWSGGYGSPYYQNRHQKLLKNKIYHHEVLKSILKLIVLPDAFFEALFSSYTHQGKEDAEGWSVTELSNKIRRERNITYLSALAQKQKELEAYLSADFIHYCSTSQAQKDLHEFKQHLATFTTTQDNRLLTKCPSLLEDIDNSFREIQHLITVKKEQGEKAVVSYFEEKFKKPEPVVEVKSEPVTQPFIEARNESPIPAEKTTPPETAIEKTTDNFNLKNFFTKHKKVLIILLFIILTIATGILLTQGGIGGIVLAAAIKPMATALGISIPGAGALTAFATAISSLAIYETLRKIVNSLKKTCYQTENNPVLINREQTPLTTTVESPTSTATILPQIQTTVSSEERVTENHTNHSFILSSQQSKEPIIKTDVVSTTNEKRPSA